MTQIIQQFGITAQQNKTVKTKYMKRPLVATLGYCINVYVLSGYAAFSSHWLLMLDGVPLSCLIDAV